ncbi:MAG: hypothetical protein FWC13_10990 [Oscillospiraceae bacterium]|nr:hypothetical protein [Oscillospiraceae bacterium]
MSFKERSQAAMSNLSNEIEQHERAKEKAEKEPCRCGAKAWSSGGGPYVIKCDACGEKKHYT